MNTMDALLTRRSVRAYKPDAIPEDILEKILEAGTYAPSGMGRQSAIIVAITNKEVRDRLSKLNARIMGVDSDPFYGAPVVLAVLARKDIPTHVYDGSLVMGNLMTAAHELGIASCWIHRAKEEFESDEGRELLAGLDLDADEYEGIGNCILGYADGPEPEAKPRKDGFIWKIA